MKTKEILWGTINKISETKLENCRQKILNGLNGANNIPQQSDIKLAIPTHRTRAWISFDEFRALIEKGENLKELCKIYSKHLIAFYSYLAQGKNHLSKEEFENMYNEGISLNEISKITEISRDNISFLREFYGIKRKGARYQKRLAKEVPLSQDAKDVIIGSMLGDGYITKGGGYSEKHSPAQLEYLKWKASFFKDITTDKSWKHYETIDKRSGTLIKTCSFGTTVHTYLQETRSQWYKKINGKWTKILPNNIADLINLKILAIWFMDDGNTDWGYRKGEKQYVNSLPQCKISSESFTYEENMELLNILDEKFGLYGVINYRDSLNKQRPYIRFCCKSSVKLIDMLKPFATPDLLYKFDEKTYTQSRNIVLKEKTI